MYLAGYLIITGSGLVNKPSESIDARTQERLDTDYDLYRVIDRNPGSVIYDLSKLTGWSSGEVYESVKRLEKEGLVHTRKLIRDGKAILIVSAAEWSELLAAEELEEFDKLEL